LNTALIISHGASSTPQYTTPAASACAALDIGGKTDWFLPSMNELNQLYTRRSNVGLQGLTSAWWFWSSSQNNAGFAREQTFSDGHQGFTTKTALGYVRAIRAF